MQSKIVTEMIPEELADVVVHRLLKLKRIEFKEVVDPILSRLKYVTSSQAAELIGVKPSTIRTWEKDGRLTAHETGKNERFLLSEVVELAADRADRKTRF